MNKTLVKCAFVGGLIAFIWGALAWTFLCPFQKMGMRGFDNEKTVESVLQDHTPTSGAYVLPYHSSDKGMTKKEKEEMREKHKEKFKNGPVAFVIMLKDGMKTTPEHIILQLIVEIVAAGLITWLLMMTKAMSYMRRVVFVATIALIGGILITIPGTIWMGMPYQNAIGQVVCLVIGWFLAGLAIAKMVKK